MKKARIGDRHWLAVTAIAAMVSASMMAATQVRDGIAYLADSSQDVEVAGGLAYVADGLAGLLIHQALRVD
jgi:hypothetical protein